MFNSLLGCHISQASRLRETHRNASLHLDAQRAALGNLVMSHLGPNSPWEDPRFFHAQLVLTQRRNAAGDA